ncbi:MAG: D-alanine--D-alanine ligase [Alphaproteobacteria bacterium]|nr:D-alanine--D-alanine ligase [Alphaproteobacteria bacterium]
MTERTHQQIAVLMGGTSAERDVSLESGCQCAQALRGAGYDVREVDVTADINLLLTALTPRPDAVFNALHGRAGEDGNIQGLLNLLQIPYTHSGLLASALAMDKAVARAIFEKEGMTVAKGRLASRDEILAGDVLPRPYVVKPNNEGSSVGIQIIQDGDNGPDPGGINADMLLVEEFIPGRELTVAVMGATGEEPKPLAVTELRTANGFYDYEAKYTDGVTQHLVPAPVSADLGAKAMDWAARAHKVLDCRGVTRADFRYDYTREALVILELNTQPGMTRLSLVPEQADYCGISFPELVSWMVETARCD